MFPFSSKPTPEELEEQAKDAKFLKDLNHVIHGDLASPPKPSETASVTLSVEDWMRLLALLENQPIRDYMLLYLEVKGQLEK